MSKLEQHTKDGDWDLCFDVIQKMRLQRGEMKREAAQSPTLQAKEAMRHLSKEERRIQSQLDQLMLRKDVLEREQEAIDRVESCKGGKGV
jgi:hypothetical protein